MAFNFIFAMLFEKLKSIGTKQLSNYNVYNVSMFSLKLKLYFLRGSSDMFCLIIAIANFRPFVCPYVGYHKGVFAYVKEKLPCAIKIMPMNHNSVRYYCVCRYCYIHTTAALLF